MAMTTSMRHSSTPTCKSDGDCVDADRRVAVAGMVGALARDDREDGDVLIEKATMTVEEFDELGKYSLPCRECARTGMAREHIDNNNAERVYCPFCGSKSPWGVTMNLKQTSTKRRKDDALRDGCSIVEVWERFKNRCVVCTLPMHALADVRLGLSRHHVTERYSPDELDCPIVPVCNACKSIVDARQREAWRWYNRLLELKGEPLSRRRPDLSPAGVSPDPVRPARQTPVGVVEGIPDDDADT